VVFTAANGAAHMSESVASVQNAQLPYQRVWFLYQKA